MFIVLITRVFLPKTWLKIGTLEINYHNCPKDGTSWFYHAIMWPKDADGMADSVDLDQTVCSDLAVLILRIFMVVDYR